MRLNDRSEGFVGIGRSENIALETIARITNLTIEQLEQIEWILSNAQITNANPDRPKSQF